MSINFPNSPALNEVYTTPDGTSFFWNGVQWVGFSSSVTLNINTVPLRVEDDASVVGTAITSINFGEYLDVTYASNRVTVDVNNVWTETDTANLYRLNSNVGLGTTNPRFKLEVGEIGYAGTAIYVNGGIKATGMVTFTTDADSEYGGRGYLTLGGETSVDGLIVGFYKDKTNIVLGHSAGGGTGINTLSRRNIFIGEETGLNISSSGASENIYIGAYAGGSYSDTNNNIFIGNGVGNNPSAPSLSGSYNVMIGPTGGSGLSYDVNTNSALRLPPIQEGSYQLVIGAGNTAWIHGNSSFNVGFGTNAPTARLHVSGGALVTGITTTPDLNIGIGYTNVRVYSGGIDLNIDAANNSTKLNLYSYYPGSDPHAISIEAPPGADIYSLVLPLTNGSQYEALTTDGNGNLSWAYPSKWYQTATGIYTGSTVSIGTQDVLGTLTVNGTGNISGILTAGSFSGNGSTLSGIVTSLVAGNNISISTSFGQVTIEASLNVPTYWTATATGIHTLSNIGIGTTNATNTLTVSGVTSTTQLYVSGISTFVNNQETVHVSGLNPGIRLRTTSGSNYIAMYYDTSATQSYLISDDKNLNIKVYSPQDVNILSGDEVMATFNSNGAVELFFDNNKTFETSSTGVIITGTTQTSNISVGTAGTVITTTGIGSVGIGTTVPQDRVHITGSTLIDNSIRVGNIANGEFRVGQILTGLGTLPGLLISANNGSIISNNTGSSGGFYLRTNGTNRWYVDNLSNQFGTGRFQLGPNVSSPQINLETSGNASFTGIITATTFSGTATTATRAVYANTAGISTYATTAGISTTSQGLTGTPNISIGVITATSATVGSAVTINSNGAVTSGIVTALDGLSTGNGTITFSVVGSDLIVNVAGIGSTTLALG